MPENFSPNSYGTEHVFKDGCMWEGGEWRIALDHECSGMGGGEPCKHCHGDHIVQRPNAYGGFFPERLWICPAVVIAKNEGGCNTTGMCLDCVMEAAKTLPAKCDEDEFRPCGACDATDACGHAGECYKRIHGPNSEQINAAPRVGDLDTSGPGTSEAVQTRSGTCVAESTAAAAPKS